MASSTRVALGAVDKANKHKWKPITCWLKAVAADGGASSTLFNSALPVSTPAKTIMGKVYSSKGQCYAQHVYAAPTYLANLHPIPQLPLELTDLILEHLRPSYPRPSSTQDFQESRTGFSEYVKDRATLSMLTTVSRGWFEVAHKRLVLAKKKTLVSYTDNIMLFRALEAFIYSLALHPSHLLTRLSKRPAIQNPSPTLLFHP